MPSSSDADDRKRKPSHHHFKVDEKYAAVCRVLRGEDRNRVALEVHVSLDRLARWERVFLDGGRQGLAQQRDRRSFSGLFLRGDRLIPWLGLFLALVAMVYFATRFFQPGNEP